MNAAPQPGSNVLGRLTGGLIAGLLLPLVAVHSGAAANDPFSKMGDIAFEDFARGNAEADFPAFFVASAEAEFRQIWTGSVSNAQPIPKIDFRKYRVIAFFGGLGSACEPYRITAVREYPEKITVEIAHPMEGRNFTASRYGLRLMTCSKSRALGPKTD
jgi:hypothetical protein